MNSLFTYENYRQFLRDHYNQKKQKSKAYSYRFFAKRAGLKSANYYKLVMDEKRNLTQHNVRKFSKGLGLTDREQVYFENLVFFNQSKDETEKEFFKRNLELARSDYDRAVLTYDQYEVLSNWYPLAIKELLLLDRVSFSPKQIAARFDYEFTPEQAREALLLLRRLGLIEVQEKTGSIRVTQQNMQTPDVAKSEALKKFHRTMIEMTKSAIDHQSSEQRCLSSLTVAVAKKDLPEAFKRIHEFRNQMDAYFSKGKSYNSVYQLNIGLFRLDCDLE